MNEKNKMKVICAWCKKTIQEGGEKVSHGVCKSCYIIFIEESAAFFNNDNHN